jgi:type IV secretion system protein VirD4
MQQSRAWDGMLARMAYELATPVGDEKAGLDSTVNRLTSWLDTPAMAASTRTSSYDLNDFVAGKVDVYVILPPHRKESLKAWLRLTTGAHVNAVLRGGIRQQALKHFILDEASTLLSSKMESITQSLDVGRGYSIRLQFYFQSMGQLQSCFPADGGQTLLSNSSLVYFGTNDYQTAETISKRCGQETIIVDGGGSNNGGGRNWSEAGGHSMSGNSSWGQSKSWSQHGRNLLNPDEVLALPPRAAITFVAGMRPIMTQLIRYYEEPWLWKKGRRRTGLKVMWVLLALAAAVALLGR